MFKNHLFLAGKLGSSTTATLKSGLLRTWDYFYNTGWDDYPPRVYMHKQLMADRMTCVNTTALTIRSARILRLAAEMSVVAFRECVRRDVERHH